MPSDGKVCPEAAIPSPSYARKYFGHSRRRVALRVVLLPRTPAAGPSRQHDHRAGSLRPSAVGRDVIGSRPGGDPSGRVCVRRREVIGAAVAGWPPLARAQRYRTRAVRPTLTFLIAGIDDAARSIGGDFQQPSRMEAASGRSERFIPASLRISTAPAFQLTAVSGTPSDRSRKRSLVRLPLSQCCRAVQRRASLGGLGWLFPRRPADRRPLRHRDRHSRHDRHPSRIGWLVQGPGSQRAAPRPLRC
jgi:hypothetical protein